MANRWLYRIQCLVFVFFSIVTSDPADPYANQPRILVRNGILVIQGAFNKDVQFTTVGQRGRVKLNDADLGNAGASASIGMMSRLLTTISILSGQLNEMGDQVNQMEENITSLANKVNRFIGTGQDRISNRAIRRISSKVNQLQDKVNTLTQLLTENECNSNPCRNGGTCVDTYNGFICNCPTNWEGSTCETDINECARFAGTSLGCQNGATCINTMGGYSCNCAANWYGIHCTQQHDDCSAASHQELCGHGTCVDEKRALPGQPKYRCICDAGWTAGSSGPACIVDIDECSGAVRRCSVNPLVVCINLPGSFHCGPCPAGYTGNGHSCADINECELNNGGCSLQPYVQCMNTIGSRTCGPCPAGYVGDGVHCSFIGVCNVNRGGCHPLATCIENTAVAGTYRECRCPAGYIGSGEGPGGCTQSAGMNCASNPCRHGTCHDVGNSFRCTCSAGFTGVTCDLEEIDACFSAPCLNGGTCARSPGGFTCYCPEGFEGPTCAHRISSCGGELPADNGTLEFPESGHTYDHMMSCEWVISVAESKVVNLTFDYFDLEGGYNCEYDFLQINDGPTSARMILNRFCGENLHGRSIVSTHNQVHLWFKSDKTVAHTGFKLNWTATDPVCGGVLNVSDYGSFNSPGYPGLYPNDRTCSWLVRVPVGKRIQFHFATLQLEEHSNCSYDYVKVYDGAVDTDAVIGLYCTTVTPPPLMTSGRSALVVFHSDGSNQYAGFHIAFSSQSNVLGCGGLLTTPTGSIRSPNYPDVYENNLNCEWLIRVHPDNRLKLTFSEFNLERHNNCSFDYVEIYSGDTDNSPLIGRYCGQNTPPEVFSLTNQLFIRFSSDNSLVHSGFKAEYKTICGGLFTDPSGILSSPYYPSNYPAQTQCIYEIRLEPGYLVNVSFHVMKLESHTYCEYDYLEVRDGDSEESPLIKRLCGRNLPENMVSSYNNMWMKFETDGSVQNLGFYAQYEAIDIGCGGVMTELRGLISTPRHPDRYPHFTTCSWILRAPPGHIVRLTFTSFSLEPDAECRFDYVVVQDLDGVQIGRYCGRGRPPVLTSMDNYLFVKFESDQSVSAEGFTASYEYLDLKQAHGCGGTYYRESGMVKSPGFPDRYPHNAHCVWILKGQSHRQINLDVETFNIEEHSSCRYDYLEIRNGEYETSPLLGKYCGTNILRNIKSHSNVLRLEFKSDDSQSGQGFQMYFDSTSMGCGGKLTSPRGSIISPNYPQPYPYNADCEWLIQVSSGSLISLTLVEIDIEEHRDCRYDYVQIFDGPTENSKSILKICNNQQNPGTVTSTGDSLLVRFRSDFSQQAGGFHLVYQTLCNNNLTGRRGVIESPNFPNTYPHNHNCSWRIQAPAGSNISLAFSHLFLEEVGSCEADYVEVLEIDLEGHQSQVGKYCGSISRPPNTIQTTTNTAIVRLVTDQSVTREGFRLEWVVRGCGGDIQYKYSGIITSPNYPNGYPFDTTCYWHVMHEPGSRIELTIMDLDMEGVPGCDFDYLRVYAGEDEHAPQLLNICNTVTAPRVVTSHGNHMVIKFNSDYTITRKGFKAIFKQLTGGCGGRFTTPEGTIMTPNFPETYNANDECDWLIQVDQSHLVILDFYDFGMPESVNGSAGYVAIYDGNSSTAPLLLRHWGQKPEGSISSTGNQMLVRLVADGNNVGNGFRAHYKTGCGGRLLADEGGVIQSPNYPDLPGIVNCSWILYAADPGESVNLIITHLFMPNRGANCTSSVLMIYDGDAPDSPLNQQLCGIRSPPPILSRGSIMHVFLTAGVFRATYGPASTHCGGSYMSLQGTFGSPGYPNSYDMDTECVWTIEAAAGNRVHMAFETFNLEDSDHCNKDYVEIHENNESGKFIGRYCGGRIPSNMTDAPKLWIKFRSDDVDTQRGFLAHFELKHDVILNGTEGEIASPGYPSAYHGNEDYKWTVYVPFGEYVSVRFLEMAITNLSPDYPCVSRIQIFDGMDDQSPLLGSFCGYQLPEPVVSTGSVIYIKSEPRFHYTGKFRLKWSATTESGVIIDVPETTQGEPCWEEVQLNSTDSFDINSPNYPENYPDGINCTYILRAPFYQHVELNVTDLETEDWAPTCQFDRLQVFYMTDPNRDDWHLNSTLCGRLNNVTVSSPSNLMKMNFKTDHDTNHKGFHSVAKSRCGSRFGGPSGVIKTEFIRSELTQMSATGSLICEYVVTVRSRRTIQLSFDKLNVPLETNCNTNYIMLRNGGSNSSPYLGSGKYCGLTAPANLETSSNELFVQVVVGSISMGVPDFELQYSEVSMGCGGNLFLTEERRYIEITSPNYPNPPLHDIECEWIITSPSGSRMRMDFDEQFHLSPECQGDGEVEYVQINDGGTDMAASLHRFCGNEQPSSVVSSGNALYVRYVTAVPNPQAGFKSKIRIAVCGGTVSAMNAVINSPNYPFNYGNSQECEWYLKMKFHFRFILRIMSFNTPRPSPGQNCSSTDYLEIRDAGKNGAVIGTYCGTVNHTAINIPSSTAYIKFKSNSARTDKGFFLTVTRSSDAGCGGYIEGQTGVLTSPNFPNALSAVRNCQWIISAPEGRRVKLTFEEFNLPRDRTTGVCLSSLQVSNATYWRRSIVDKEKICGNTLPSPIESSSSQLIIQFNSGGLSPGQGFSLTYTTDEENMCGGLLQPPSGVIETPTFPLQNDSYVSCKWKMPEEGPGNQTLVMRFDVVDLPGAMANYCREGVVYFTGRMYMGRVCGNYTTELVVTSPFLTVFTRLVANLEKPIRIHGTYNISDCGGIISSNQGEITTPGYPISYPQNTVCHWLIQAPAGETITLTIDDLRMEENCDKDYLLVRNGHYMHSPVAGRFCGTHAPAPITSSGSWLTVIFHTDAYGTAPGVRMHTAQLQRGCGGLIHMTKGNISSTNYPNRYDNNIECVWTIEFVPGYRVKLEFTGRFDIEMDNSCSKDYVMVEEYNDDGTWTEVLKKCGPANPEPFISQNNKVRITFHTNEGINGDGFNIAYSTGCGGNFTSLIGEIFSPNYPGAYDNTLNCTYTIGRPFQYISLSFDPYFSVESNNNCRFDHLLIYHGNITNSTEQGPYCGSEAPAPRTLLGPVTIRFVTDNSYAAHGFKAHYEIMDCGATLTEPTGVITSPKTSAGYLNEVDCTWQILAPSDRVVVLKFSHFDLELNYRCWQDYLEIRDGLLDTGSLVGKMCGNSSSAVKSTGNVLTLKLHISSSTPGRGFSAFYHTTYGINQGCGGTLNMSSGEIQSLDADSDGFYEPNLDCSWLVMGDVDQVLQVTFDRFDVEPSTNDTCIYDFVELKEGIGGDSSVVGIYCGSRIPTSVMTSSNRLYVIFHSDEKINKAGFKLRFQSVSSPCGPSALTLTSEPQTLTSPNYPNPYPINLRCRWTVTGLQNRIRAERQVVQLTIDQLDVPCGGDYVEVQKLRHARNAYQRRFYVSPSSASGNSPIRLCGSSPVHDIIAQSGMSITFHSDSVENNARGFSITFKESSCNRNYTAESGILTNPSFPGRFNSGKKCAMTILVPQGKTISAFFHRLEMYDPQDGCPNTYVKVYDGADNSSTLLGTYCGFSQSEPVFSTGNALRVESSMQHSMGLYYINYFSTDQGRGCGGRIYAEEGTVTSPLYPQLSDRNTECLWYIAVPGYHTVRVAFQTLLLNSTRGCDSNFVELYDGSSDQMENRVVRYCGTDTAGTHMSTSNEVTIKFKSDSSGSGSAFVLTFSTNPFPPDTSLTLIQKHSTEEVTNPTDSIIYLP